MNNYTEAIVLGNKNLVLWGNNATLDADGKGGFFISGAEAATIDGDDDAPAGSLELHDIVMKNGRCGSSSIAARAALVLNGVVAKIINCMFLNNTANVSVPPSSIVANSLLAAAIGEKALPFTPCVFIPRMVVLSGSTTTARQLKYIIARSASTGPVVLEGPAVPEGR
jgi:hypothetical protein